MRLCHVPLATLLISVGAASAVAEPFCRTVMADGRVVPSEPFRGVQGLSCPNIAAAPRMRLEPGGSTLPSVSFTTGPIGPFTTGEIGPFTTGPIGPLTTFSNSHPSPAPRR